MGNMEDFLKMRVEKIQRENTPLEMLIADLRWQFTFVHEEEFDWTLFQETVERAKVAACLQKNHAPSKNA